MSMYKALDQFLELQACTCVHTQKIAYILRTPAVRRSREPSPMLGSGACYDHYAPSLSRSPAQQICCPGNWSTPQHDQPDSKDRVDRSTAGS